MHRSHLTSHSLTPQASSQLLCKKEDRQVIAWFQMTHVRNQVDGNLVQMFTKKSHYLD